MLLLRVEQASLLLGELMSRLQLGTGLLLPMLRIVLTSLTVDGVAVYQVQASGAISREEGEVAERNACGKLPVDSCKHALASSCNCHTV